METVKTIRTINFVFNFSNNDINFVCLLAIIGVEKCIQYCLTIFVNEINRSKDNIK